MRIRVTKTGAALRREVVEGEPLLYREIDGQPHWTPADNVEGAVRVGGVLALLVELQDGSQCVWLSTKIVRCEHRETGGWLVKTENSLFAVEELSDDAEATKARRSTGMVPVLHLSR